MARPILFSAPMVVALIAGRKSQTRRIMKPQPSQHHWEHLPDYKLHISDLTRFMDGRLGVRFAHTIPRNTQWDYDRWVMCPYGRTGDLLWVRETHTFCPKLPSAKRWSHTAEEARVIYAADGEVKLTGPHGLWEPKLRPSIHMPRWASRLTLRITDVRVQSVNEITNDDARAEGVQQCEGGAWDYMAFDWAQGFDCRASFCTLWQLINGVDSWIANPFVWAISFEVIKDNVDAVLRSQAKPDRIDDGESGLEYGGAVKP